MLKKIINYFNTCRSIIYFFVKNTLIMLNKCFKFIKTFIFYYKFTILQQFLLFLLNYFIRAVI